MFSFSTLALCNRKSFGIITLQRLLIWYHCLECGLTFDGIRTGEYYLLSQYDMMIGYGMTSFVPGGGTMSAIRGGDHSYFCR